MYASVDTARQLQLPFFLICGTLFRAYGPLGRFRAHLYDYMVKFVVMKLCQVQTLLWPHGQSLTYVVADIFV